MAAIVANPLSRLVELVGIELSTHLENRQVIELR
jgi:hypothetical protein